MSNTTKTKTKSSSTTRPYYAAAAQGRRNAKALRAIITLYWDWKRAGEARKKEAYEELNRYLVSGADKIGAKLEGEFAFGTLCIEDGEDLALALHGVGKGQWADKMYARYPVEEEDEEEEEAYD